MKTRYKTRKSILEYYLQSAKTTLAKMYWMGRLDEFEKVQNMDKLKRRKP